MTHAPEPPPHAHPGNEEPDGPAGVDLARIALHHARQAAKAHGATTPKPATRTTRRTRRDGRDPLTLQAAIGQLMDNRGWDTPTAGGHILDQWPTIAPELAGKVAAVAYDPERGLLHLRPASPAYRTQLRMLSTQLVARINAKTGRQTVRGLRILPPGPIPGPAPGLAPAGALEEPAPPRPETRPRTRDDAADGYHQARAALLATKPQQRTDPALAAAVARQTAAAAREPEAAFTEAAAARQEQPAPATGGNDAEAVRQAAIRRARTERAGRTPAVPTAFGPAA